MRDQRSLNTLCRYTLPLNESDAKNGTGKEGGGVASFIRRFYFKPSISKMCGIFAVLGPDQDLMRQSFERGRHRGPESSSFQKIDHRVTMGFHRLAINGYARKSANQPIRLKGCTLVCNGEIYNWKHLHAVLKEENTTGSDCEIIVRMYRRYGINHTLLHLDGVYAFVLRDGLNGVTYIARDIFGVRPLFQCRFKNDGVAFASELKMLTRMKEVCAPRQFPPATLCRVHDGVDVPEFSEYFHLPERASYPMSRTDALNGIRALFTNAVRKRVRNTDREIACLLSGGLDSSLVTAIVAREVAPRKVHSYSIGMPGSPDLEHAKIAAQFIGSIHHSIELSRDDFIDAVHEVIWATESYDVTTVRASVGNWLVARYIRETCDAKVIFNGDGSDECCGGYLYMCHAPDEFAFDRECRRLLRNIHFFDVLRSDRCISAHGLEARTPFLDRTFVNFYMSIPPRLRFSAPGEEKKLLRDAFAGTNLLPANILFRRKEAFSDGVSARETSWYQILQTHVKTNQLASSEQEYYAKLFRAFYPGCSHVIPEQWMPRFVNASDPSARTLPIYSA